MSNFISQILDGIPIKDKWGIKLYLGLRYDERVLSSIARLDKKVRKVFLSSALKSLRSYLGLARARQQRTNL